MLSEAAVLEHFATWDLNDEERRYLDLHSPRFAYVLPLVAAGEPERILDVGPHFLTELLDVSFPSATLDTLGFRNPSCYREERVARHFDFDLNEVQAGVLPELPEHDVVVMAEIARAPLHGARARLALHPRPCSRRAGALILQTPNAVGARTSALRCCEDVNPFGADSRVAP